MAIFYGKGVDLVDMMIKQTDISCFNCYFREGRYCNANDIELELADVKDNILRFKIDHCDAHQDRNLIND